MKSFLLHFALILLVINKTTSLSCYQCGLNDWPKCENEANSNNLDQCSPPDDNYCMLANSTINGFNTVLRYCASTDTDSCSRVPTPPGVIVQESCFSYACNRDGCNSSTVLRISFVFVFMAAMISFILCYFE